MPVDVQKEVNKHALVACKNCNSLMTYDKNESIPGYEYGCKCLERTAFNIIANEVIEKGSIFMDCPKLKGTIAEGVRYKPHVVKS